MSRIPDEIQFVDEQDKPYDDIDPVRLTAGMKLMLATQCIQQKQSLDTVVQRILRRAIKDASA